MRIEEVAKKVQVIYTLFNWCWGDSDVPPTLEEIKKTFKTLVKDLKRLKTDLVETGGLYVEKNAGVYTGGFRSEVTFNFDYDEIEKL